VSTPSPDRVLDAHGKAGVLAEALPYIREFSGKTVVVKYGGHAMDDPATAELFAQDVVLMRLVGMNPVVVHGGGPQITDLMRRLGKEPEFVDGMRVTDAETIDIARMALMGKVNRDIVTSLNQHGSYAMGLSGEDAGLLRVVPRDPRLGFVGDVSTVDPAVLERVLREELIPVIATIGVDDMGQAYNVNADAAAGAIAAALRAEKLVYLTDVAGIYEDFGDDSSLISETDVAGLQRLLGAGKVGEGMIPKVRSCIDALEHGVHRAHVLDGRVAHALLLEFFTREGVGTVIDRHSSRASSAESQPTT
jgi:acetylglutamate kinase